MFSDKRIVLKKLVTSFTNSQKTLMNRRTTPLPTLILTVLKPIRCTKLEKYPRPDNSRNPFIDHVHTRTVHYLPANKLYQPLMIYNNAHIFLPAP